ncbi:hypothetical protein Hanom_Chr14g01317891 [Helianthus anomalus]
MGWLIMHHVVALIAKRQRGTCTNRHLSQLLSVINITYLKVLDLARREYTVKVRIRRLWKQPMYNNPEHFYSIEMIVVDKQGKTMQANVLRRWFPIFEHLLKMKMLTYIPEQLTKLKLVFIK